MGTDIRQTDIILIEHQTITIQEEVQTVVVTREMIPHL